MALYQIDRTGWAVAEWNSALSRFDDTQRRLAVRVAQDNGWFDRAVFALGKQPQEQRLYDLRFPLHHDATIRRESARNAIDPAWVARRSAPKPSPRARARLPTPWA
jgi:soluble lytic murein transglycosylase